jgi:lipopolysaccharide/colanic/teichoic acid biosynthesis glycosyltransferase
MTAANRALDLLVAVGGLVLVVPLMGIVAVVERVSGDRGPLLYRAQRVGEDGRPFAILKLRTMVASASGPRITVGADPRITRIGRLLRRYRLDEMPQLLNVLRGEMTLVGPRPEDPAFVDLDDPLHRRVFSARPGITGLAQLEFHDEAERLLGSDPDPDRRYREVVLPAKLALDARYLDRRSFRSDVAILAKTIGLVFWGGPPRG